MLLNRMNRSLRRCGLLLAGIAFVALSTSLMAAPGDRAGKDGDKGYRKLAPGVETTIPLDRNEEETADTHPVVELVQGVPNLEWTPKSDTPKSSTLFDKASNTIFRRGVWQFQLTFKPMRMIRVDVPQPNGKMKKKLIWYMVYRVNNPGKHLTPKAIAPESKWSKETYEVAKANSSRQMLANIGRHRFVPTFHLRSHETKKEYLDQIIPVAKKAIYLRERPPCELKNFYNTVEISKAKIPVSTADDDNSVWGLVTWMDVDPKIDTFSVFVQGLTNAYKWTDPPGVYQEGDPAGKGRIFTYKTLQLNFSRQGDEFLQREEEILLGVEGEVDYKWIYR